MISAVARGLFKATNAEKTNSEKNPSNIRPSETH